MRIGAVIERPSLERSLDVEALAQTQLIEGVVRVVDKLSTARLVHAIGVHHLSGLVIVCQSEEVAWEQGREALRLTEQDPFALRVLTTADVCGGWQDRAQATGRAALLLRAAAAMVREYPWLRPANIRLRLGGLRGRLSRRALLTAPRPKHEVIPAINEARCAASRGCNLCQEACPFDAIRLDGASASVDKDRCRDCGICVSVCPTGAADHPFYQRRVLDAGLVALLAEDARGPQERIVALACRGAMRSLHEAGRRRLAYPAAVLPLEMPSAGYPDLYLILRAFDLGAAGVAILSCGGSCGSACQPRACEQRLSAVGRVLDALGLGSGRLAVLDAGSADRLAADLTGLAAELLHLPPHPVGQTPSVPARVYDYRTAGLLANMFSRTGDGGALSVQDEGLPFGQAEFDVDACSLCGLCADACPTGALRYPESSSSVSLDFAAGGCVGCRLCADACPEDALKIARRLEGSSLTGDRVVLKADSLRRCGQCGRGYAPEAMVSRILSSLGARGQGANLGYCPDCRMIAGAAGLAVRPGS